MADPKARMAGTIFFRRGAKRSTTVAWRRTLGSSRHLRRGYGKASLVPVPGPQGMPWLHRGKTLGGGVAGTNYEYRLHVTLARIS